MPIELPEVKCRRCGHVFVARVPNPPKCRVCGIRKPVAEEPAEQSESEPTRLRRAG
jgi:rubredoxin